MSIKHHVERKCRRTAAGMLTVVCVVCQYVYTCNVCECVEELISPFSTHMFSHILQGHRVFLQTKMYGVFTPDRQRGKKFSENLHKKCVLLIPSHLSHINCAVSVLEADSYSSESAARECSSCSSMSSLYLSKLNCNDGTYATSCKASENGA